MARLINILFAFDVFMFAVCTLGASYPSESFSSAAYRAESLGKFYGYARPLVDWLFSLVGQTNHCRNAYFCAKLNIPQDQR